MTNNKCKSCGSCGMPLEKASDYALGDVNSAYCCYCTDKKGQLFPYEKILESNTHYYIESQGLNRDAATKMAMEVLAAQPAWAGRN